MDLVFWFYSIGLLGLVAMAFVAGWCFGSLRGYDRGFEAGCRHGSFVGKTRAVRAIVDQCRETYGQLGSHIESDMRGAIHRAWEKSA